MKFLKELLDEFAGVDDYGYEDEEWPHRDQPLDTRRLKKLLHYYIDGWSGFPDRPDRYTRRVMDAIQDLEYADLSRLPPEQEEKARLVLQYGSDVFEEATPEQLEEARRAWKRVKVKGRAVLKRWYRCTSGPKKGKMVSNPRVCATRKDPKKVRLGRVIARRRKAIRIRKSQVTARTATHRMMVKMNKRLSAPVVRRTD